MFVSELGPSYLNEVEALLAECVIRPEGRDSRQLHPEGENGHFCSVDFSPDLHDFGSTAMLFAAKLVKKQEVMIAARVMTSFKSW